MVSDAVILKLKGFLTEQKLSFATFKELDKKSTKDFIEKNVDIFGNLNYNLNNYLDLGYFFSYDKDLKYSNLEGLNLDLSLNYKTFISLIFINY